MNIDIDKIKSEWNSGDTLLLLSSENFLEKLHNLIDHVNLYKTSCEIIINDKNASKYSKEQAEIIVKMYEQYMTQFVKARKDVTEFLENNLKEMQS